MSFTRRSGSCCSSRRRLAPWPLWWILPAVMVGWALSNAAVATRVGHHGGIPCLAPTVHLLTGNPTIWLVAALAMGTLYRWPSAFLLTKVTIAPLGLWGFAIVAGG